MFDKVKAFYKKYENEIGVALFVGVVVVSMACGVVVAAKTMTPVIREVLPKDIVVDFINQGENKFLILNGKVFSGINNK